MYFRIEEHTAGVAAPDMFRYYGDLTDAEVKTMIYEELLNLQESYDCPLYISSRLDSQCTDARLITITASKDWDYCWVIESDLSEYQFDKIINRFKNSLHWKEWE